MMQLVNWSDVNWVAVAAIATLAAAIAAAVAARFSYRALETSLRIVEEQRAADSVKTFLDLAIRHPELSSGQKADRRDWFLLYLLMTVRNVLIAHPADKSWKRFAEMQIGRFSNELREWTRHDDHARSSLPGIFGKEVEGVVKEVLARQESACQS